MEGGREHPGTAEGHQPDYKHCVFLKSMKMFIKKKKE